MATIHRSYQMLIEESVTVENRQQRKRGTDKEHRLNLKTQAALTLTNEMFQDAVCYYTLMLAGMVKDAQWIDETFGYARWMQRILKDAGWATRQEAMKDRPINPLWKHIIQLPETAKAVARLSKEYPHAIFHGAKDAEDLIRKAFCYRGEDRRDGTRQQRRRQQPPGQQLLIETFVRNLMPEAVKVAVNGDELQDMKSFAGAWSAHLCNPAGRSRPKGTGVYDTLHAELRNIVVQSAAGQLWNEHRKAHLAPDRAKTSPEQRKQLRTAVEQQRSVVISDASLLTAVRSRVKELAETRAADNVKQDADALQAAISDALKPENRKPGNTEESVRAEVQREFSRKAASARETTLGAFQRAFNQPRNVSKLKLAPHLALLRAEVASLQALYKQSKSPHLASAKPEDKRLQRLQERNKKDAGEFMELLYRLRWVWDRADLCDLAAADVLAFVVDNEPPAVEGRPAYQTTDSEPLFPFFTNSLGIPIPDQVVWDDFETAAFKRAAEDVFKYANRTSERRQKIKTLTDEMRELEGQGRKSEKKNKDGTPRYAFFGMDGDERRARMEAVLGKLGKDRASGDTGYGLRPSTIGGWAYLRPELLKTYARQVALRERLAKRRTLTAEDEEKLEAHCETQLLASVDKARSKSGGGFGSADFFNALCQTENNVLWLEEWPNPQPWHAPDFVAHYTRYSKKREDLLEIADDTPGWPPKPINYTWPGQLHMRKRERSFRPFDFKCDIRTDPQIDLFSKSDKGEIERITTNKADKGKPVEYPLTLSFRRLKRDRITDAEGNSVEAFFAPPKIAVKGALPPPVLAGPRVRPDDFTSKELVAFLEDLPKKSEQATLLKDIAGQLAQHHREMQRLTNLPRPSKKSEAQKIETMLRKERDAAISLLCDELNRLIAGEQPLYKIDDLSKAQQQRIVKQAAGLEHRQLNREAIEKTLGGFLKHGTSCYNENVALLPPKRDGGAFHFMFAVEVDADELKDFRVSPLLEWQQFQNGKEGHAHLRWPVDLNTETDRRKRKAGKAKASGADEDESEEEAGKGPALPKRDELWCADAKLEIHALFVDLGVRFAGAWSRARIRKAAGTKPDTAHIISPSKNHPDHDAEVWCEFYGQEGTFRVQGEDASVWHRPKGGNWPDRNGEKDGWRFGRELYGSRGRLAAAEEITKFKEIAESLFPATNRFPLPAENSDAGRFIPAMAEHLVARLDRRLGRINFLFNLRWRAEGLKEQDDQTRQFTRDRVEAERAQHYRMIVEALAPSKLRPQPEETEELRWNDELRNALTDNWDGLDDLLKKKPKRAKDRRDHEEAWAKKIAADKRWRWSALADATHKQLTRLLNELGMPGEAGVVAQVARFVWPLRDKCWNWQKYIDDKHPSLLSTELLPAGSEKRKIIGQGGLNMQRIDSLQHFRRCCHSLAKNEKRAALGRFPGKVGVEPVIVARDESAPDPCPSLLDKINELRDQRVDQTAAMILAEALGLELMNPADVSVDGLRKWQLKSQRDVHGRYQRRKIILDGEKVEVPQCSMIVVEDLSRYLTSQDRSRFENRRLMEWSHRQVIKKLKDMAQIFGVEIVAVDARYSSRFCSKTHVPGVRAAEVKRGFEKEHPWRKWHDEKFNSKPTKRAQHIRDVVKLFDTHHDFSKTLLVEMEGGPLFLPFNADAPINADINASKNIGFRAVAHPDLWEFFPVIRTETAGDDKLRVINRRGLLAALPPDDPQREFRPIKEKPEKHRSTTTAAGGDDDETSERPYLFVAGMSTDCPLRLADSEETYDVSPTNNELKYRTARGRLFWSRVVVECQARIRTINARRLRQWEDELPGLGK